MFVFLVLMLMLMSWVFSLAYASVCAYAYACAYALVKTSLNPPVVDQKKITAKALTHSIKEFNTLHLVEFFSVDS